jgi:hypothetical protein
MATYDPEKIDLIIAGVTITGFGEDDIEVAPNEENAVTEKVGVKGELSRAEQADKTGELRFSLQDTSPSNAFLQGLAATKTSFATLFKDRSSGSPLTVIDADSRIKNRPTHTRGKEGTQVPYILSVSSLNPISI